MSSTDPISWPTAKRVAARVAGSEPFSHSYLAASIEQDFIDLTRRAEDFITEATGLIADGPARIRVTDRAGWVNANINVFRRYSRPLLSRLPNQTNAVSVVGRQVTGAQAGLILGWLSTRVLGQYDLMIDREHEPEEQDFLYYVMPNILTLEKRYAFPPKEFRLWIALHECTHRAQFTGVPWLPAHFRSLVDELMSDVDADATSKAGAALKQLLEQRKGRQTSNSNLFEYFATQKQKAVLDKLTGLMALLEGHADVTMSRAAGTFIPEAERFHRVMNHRRANASGVAKVFQRLLGMEAKLRQYIEGASFVREVEKHGGRPLFDLVWQKASNLPSGSEIRDPQKWIDRVGAAIAPA